MKSELDARPVYLQKPERIAGHFLACYIAVVLTRIFQIKILHDKYGSGEIYDLFHDFKVTKAQRQYVNCSRNNDLIEDMSRVYKLPLTNYFLTSKELKKVLNYRLVPMV
jgi:hypothetical protein